MIDTKLPVSKKNIVDYIKRSIETQDRIKDKVMNDEIWKEDLILEGLFPEEDNEEAIRIAETLVAYAEAICRIREVVERAENQSINALRREVIGILDDVEKGYL